TYIDLYRIDPQPVRIEAIKANIDSVISSGRYDDWTWIDAIQMAMPIFVKLGVTLNDTKYFDYMYKITTISSMWREERGYTIRKINYGGVIKILSPRIRSRMAKIAIGRGVTVGYWLP